MSKLYMLAGGIVEGGAGVDGSVSAFLAYNPRPGVSRLFKVSGALDAPLVTELPSATTVDLAGFRSQLEQELESVLVRIRTAGGTPAIAEPKADWVADIVRRHLSTAEGVEVN